MLQVSKLRHTEVKSSSYQGQEVGLKAKLAGTEAHVLTTSPYSFATITGQHCSQGGTKPPHIGPGPGAASPQPVLAE